MKLEDFDSTVEAFLNTQEPNVCQEYWCSRKELAEGVLADLRKYMYAGMLEQHERYVEFLKLKTEFEPNSDRNEYDL